MTHPNLHFHMTGRQNHKFVQQVVNAMVDQSFHSKQADGRDPSSAISETIEQFSAFQSPQDPGLFPHLRYRADLIVHVARRVIGFNYPMYIQVSKEG